MSLKKESGTPLVGPPFTRENAVRFSLSADVSLSEEMLVEVLDAIVECGNGSRRPEPKPSLMEALAPVIAAAVVPIIAQCVPDGQRVYLERMGEAISSAPSKAAPQGSATPPRPAYPPPPSDPALLQEWLRKYGPQAVASHVFTGPRCFHVPAGKYTPATHGVAFGVPAAPEEPPSVLQDAVHEGVAADMPVIFEEQPGSDSATAVSDTYGRSAAPVIPARDPNAEFIGPKDRGLNEKPDLGKASVFIEDLEATVTDRLPCGPAPAIPLGPPTGLDRSSGPTGATGVTH